MTLTLPSIPSKRVKLDSAQIDGAVEDDSSPVANPTVAGLGSGAHSMAQIQAPVTPDDAAKELDVGITAFVDDSRAVFKGILKKRYTDFLVNEILPDGTVQHLRSMRTKSAGGRRAGGEPFMDEEPSQREEVKAVSERTNGDSETKLEENSQRPGGELADC